MSKQISDKIINFKEEALANISKASDMNELNALRVNLLGKKGGLTEILKSLGTLSPDERKEIGQKANGVKQVITQALEKQLLSLKQKEILKKIESETLDVTLEGFQTPYGSHHPVMQVYEQTRQIFRNLGFDISEGPEIESDYYNFEALNMPPNHPARDMQDTFYLPDGRVLRTHTSPVQIRVMEEQKPPIAMIAPGVVYRRDSDQTHTPMFHQVEGLLVDTDVTFGHLKAIIQEYLEKIFDRKLKFRFRPSFFPFTEPSAEVDMTCVICDGKGCRVCKETGWLEIMGCGMVDPAVFKCVNIDSQKYAGYAFGGGLDRIAMLKYGINDLRLLFENDIRFLRQF
jgi:phenylalanyl-tRNA synthetase alpha chain